jgi:hypothetical protein
VWPGSAGCRLTCRLAVIAMAGNGLVWPGSGICWLPDWLPGIVTDADVRIPHLMWSQGREVSLFPGPLSGTPVRIIWNGAPPSRSPPGRRDHRPATFSATSFNRPSALPDPHQQDRGTRKSTRARSPLRHPDPMESDQDSAALILARQIATAAPGATVRLSNSRGPDAVTDPAA